MSIDSKNSNINLTPVGNLMTGMLTSCFNISLFHPLYTAKTCFMSEKNVALKHLYKGFFANLLCDVSYQGVLFLSYGLIEKQALSWAKRKLTPIETSACGFIAGLTVAPLISYLERVMIIQQIAHESLKTDKISLAKVALKKHETEGLKGAVRGLCPTMLRESIHATCFFGLSKLFKQAIGPLEEDSSSTSHICYLMAGASSGLITTPFDLVKTKMQHEISPSHKSMREIIKEITSDFKKPQKLFMGASARVATTSATMMGMGYFSDKIKHIIPTEFHEV